MTTVFDVATELIERSGGSIEAVKLQKLCFYAFGWYAHLTGEPLYGERFYAMPKGPVISELLSAHARQSRVDLSMMTAQREEREDQRDEMDPYKRAVLDAVWSCYGEKTSWALVDMTHEESVWDDAWKSRRTGAKRADLPREDVVEYFLCRTPKPTEKLDLPPSMISRASTTDLAAIEAEALVHRSFVDAVHAFRFAS